MSGYFRFLRMNHALNFREPKVEHASLLFRATVYLNAATVFTKTVTQEPFMVLAGAYTTGAGVSNLGSRCNWT